MVMAAAQLETAPARGIWGRPRTVQLGASPIAVLNEDSRRLGCWLWATGQSLVNAGQQAVPAVGAVVVKLSNVPPGTYDAVIQTVFVAGAPVALDATNMQLQVNNSAVGTALHTPAALNQVAARSLRIQVPAQSTVQVVEIAAGTGGVTYQAEIALNPVEPVLVGLDNGVQSGSLGASAGWPVTATPFFLACAQEVWAMAAGAGPVDLHLWEVFLSPKGPVGIGGPYEGTRPD
jgi:hypothetical protein